MRRVSQKGAGALIPDSWAWAPARGSMAKLADGGVRGLLLVFLAQPLAESLPPSPFFLQNMTERHDRPAHVFLQVMVL
jgi:hypothetical protein